MELVFFDTTTLYFEGEGGGSIGQRGNSKDHRPDLKQVVVGVVLDNHGNPICSEFLPGNTTDVTTLIPVAQRLKERFGVERICIVADRGMISASTINDLESMGWEYILGARMRLVKEVRDEVLSRGGRFREVYGKRQKSTDPAPLKVKEVKVGDTRYIICHNEEEAQKSQYDRSAIIESLQQQLKQGDKSLVGNKGFRRYLKSVGKTFEIDEEKVAYDQRFDGKYVLRTNTRMSTEDVALKYKQLWTVETIFRTMKSTLETRPIFHHCDDTIRGHVFCSFLALVLRKKLQDRLAEKGLNFEWAHIVRDVDSIEEVGVVHNNQRFTIRTEAKGVAGKVFQAVGIALPPVLRNEEKCGTTPVPIS
jgi:transposase